MTDTAVAVREDQHPIIAQIDAKMDGIAKMLPAGMDAGRFRGIVLKAMLKNPELWACTPASVVDAVTDAAEAGLEPTGALGRAWLLPYNNKQRDGTWRKEAQLIIGYRGYGELAWRADKTLLNADAVREGDEFSYQRGTDAFLRHVPDLADPEREASDANITYVYAVATFPDGRSEWEVMSRTAVERIADRAKKRNPVWGSDWGEMAKKTVLRRLLKKLPLSAQISRYLARDEEIDFDTPVERMPDPKRDGLRDRIAQRTAAMRGEPTNTGEPEAGTSGGAEPEGSEGQPSSPSGGSSAKGDPWMRRLHAVAAERGMDHDALHDWAVDHFRVESLSDLTTPQRATFMELVERMEVMPQPGQTDGPSSVKSPAPAIEMPQAGEGVVPPAATDAAPAGGTRAASRTHGADDPAAAKPDEQAAAGPPPGESSPVAPSDTPGQVDGSASRLGSPAPASPSMDDVLAVSGGEEIPPKPGTDAYKALPAEQRAKARAHHAKPQHRDVQPEPQVLGLGADE